VIDISEFPSVGEEEVKFKKSVPFEYDAQMSIFVHSCLNGMGVDRPLGRFFECLQELLKAANVHSVRMFHKLSAERMQCSFLKLNPKDCLCSFHYWVMMSASELN